MSKRKKTFFACGCGQKTSTTEPNRAKAKICIHCLPDLDAAQAKAARSALKPKRKPAAKKAAPSAKPKREPAAAKAVPRRVAAAKSIGRNHEPVVPVPAAPIPAPVPETPEQVAASAPASVPAAGSLSALDGAALVLRRATAPMSAKDISRAILAAHLCPGLKGKTPDQTIQAAIGREIRGLGEASRFVKVARGRFAAANHGG